MAALKDKHMLLVLDSSPCLAAKDGRLPFWA
jgi:hypothetical protein